MRVLINYCYQYYPFTTASYLEMELRRRKSIEVFRLGENRIPCADLIINVEPCEMIVAYPGKPSVYWEIDNHIHRGADVDKYQRVSHLFVAQKFYLPFYPENKTTWLPLAADPEKHFLFPYQPLKYDVGFLGNDTYPRRRDLLDRIGQNYKLLRGTSQPGEPYSRLLSRCRLLFNCSMDNDVNMRVFEAISIGRLLLTDKVEGQDELFVDGEHYISFSDWPDLDGKIKMYLENETEREKIAKAGAAWIRANHTYGHRLDKILEVCGFF